MATYEELSNKRNSKKIVAAILRFIEFRDSINFEAYSTYYQVPVSNHVESVFTDTELTKGSDKDSLSAGEWFYENKVLYINVSPQDLYIKERLYIASDYIVLKENITSGNLVPFEPRIDSLPDFKRKIDPLENDGYDISTFSIKLNNKDNALFDEFNNGLFKNQKCDIYSIINPDEIDESEIKKLATAIVDEIDLDDDFGTIKLVENTKLNAQLTTQLVQSTVKDENYPIILGAFDKYQPIQDSDDEYIDTGIDVNYTMVGGSEGASFSGPDEIYKFCYPGFTISFGSNGPSTFFGGEIVEVLSNGRIKINSGGILAGYDETLRLFIKKDDYIFYKNNIKITNIFNGNTGVDTGIGGTLSEFAQRGDNYFSVNENFSFLEEDDIIRYKTGSSECDLIVDYWDNINKRIYLKEAVPFDNANLVDECLFYDYVQRCNIGDSYSLKRERSRWILSVGIASTLNSSGAGSYFTMKAKTFSYYIWFNVDSNNTNPSPAGMLAGYECSILSTDTQQQVMDKLLDTINDNLSSEFTATRSNQEEPTGPQSLEIQINDFLIDYDKRELTLVDMSATGGARIGWAKSDEKLKVKPAFSVDYLDNDPNSVQLTIDQYAPNLYEYSTDYNPSFYPPIERLIIESTSVINLRGTASGDKERRRIFSLTGANEFENAEEGDIFTIERDGVTFTYVIVEVEDHNSMYVHTTANFGATGTFVTSGETWRIINRLEVDSLDISIDGIFTRPNYSNITKDLMENHYSLTTNDFLQSSLDSIDTNYSYINLGLIIDSNERLYKHINNINQVFNFVTFVNRDGLIEFQNIYFKAPATSTLEQTQCYKSDNKIFSNIRKQVDYKYNLDLKENSYTTKELSSPNLNAIQTYLNLTEITDFQSTLMQDIFTQETGNGRTYESEIKEKFFAKFSEVELYGDLSLLNYDIGSVINLDGFPKINSAIDYIVVETRTNGFTTRLKLLGIIDIFDIEAFIVDENGNSIVSELDDEIVS